MNVHEIPIEQLKPYNRNAKKHSEKQIEQLMKSIDLTKGLRQPIVIDSNNVVVCGHGRLEAAKRLGYITVPCECIDDMTEDEIKMYRILDNRSASIEYDLEIEMGELMDIEFDVSEYDMDISQLEYDIAEQQEKHQQYKEDTQHDVLNIVNLEKGQFLGEGLYDIPILEPVTELPPIREWISFNYVLSDKDPEGTAYMSTSYNAKNNPFAPGAPGGGGREVVMNVKAAANTQVVFGAKKQSEIVINKGTNMRITGIHYDGTYATPRGKGTKPRVVIDVETY